MGEIRPDDARVPGAPRLSGYAALGARTFLPRTNCLFAIGVHIRIRSAHATVVLNQYDQAIGTGATIQRLFGRRFVYQRRYNYIASHGRNHCLRFAA